MFARSALALLVGAGILAQGSLAFAALTDSEKGQLRGFFEAAQLSTVSRMRALAARPDLTQDETAEALSAAVREQPFTSTRQRYAQELMFGPASHASRAVLLAPLCRALLARADVVLRERPGSLAGFIETEPQAFEELMRLHQFIGATVSPQSGGAATIRNEPLLAVAQAYGQHVTRHAVLMGHRNKAEGRALLVRSQVALNLALLSSRLSNREEAASWLGLDDISKGMFLRTGAVLETSSEGSADRTAAVARILEAAPAGLHGISLVLVDKVSPAALQPQAAVLAVRASLAGTVSKRQGWWTVGRGDDPDQAVCEAAWAVSARLADRAMHDDAKLALVSIAALGRAAGKGGSTFLAPWLLAASLDRDAHSSPRPVEHQALAAASGAMLLVDAPRTIDVALSRWLAGQGQAFEQLMLGMSVLAAGNGGAVQFGTRAGEGSVAANLSVSEGMVSSFELGGRSWTMERSASGAPAGLRIDGREPGGWALSSASAVLSAAERWSAADREWLRLSGAPRAALIGDGGLIVGGSSDAGPDAVQLKGSWPGGLHARVRIEAGEGGIIARASAVKGGYSGIALLISCEPGAAQCKARLVHVDADGQQELATAGSVGAQPANGFEVDLSIEGKHVRATVGKVQCTGELPRSSKGNGAGVTVGKGGRIEVRDVRIQAAVHHGPSGPRT